MQSSLRDLRQRANVKQATICRLLHLDPAFYSKVESGSIQPSRDQEWRIRDLVERLARLRNEYWFADLNDPRVARSLLDMEVDRAS